MVAMINLALSTQKPVSQLDSYHPWQVLQMTGSVVKSHSSQRSSSHIWQIAKDTNRNNITLDMNLIQNKEKDMLNKSKIFHI